MAQSPGFIHGHGVSASQLPETLGAKLSAASLSVVFASDAGLPVEITSSPSDPLYTRLTDGSTAYDTNTGAQLPATLGQKAMAASLAVVIASDQGALTVGLPTGASTAAKQDTGNTSIASIDTKTPALGQALAAASVPVVLTAAQLTTLTPLSTVAATQSGTWNVGTVTTVTTVSAVTAITNALPAGSNIIGNVRIDQTTPGTTNGVVVNTLAPQTVTTAAWQAEGAVAFGSITSGYVTALTPSAATKILIFRNNTNAAVSVSLDAGSTTHFTFDPGDATCIDYQNNALVSTTTAIQVKYAVGAPTSGSFRINACH
jgi:hypothetical protein